MTSSGPSSRIKRWMPLFGSMANVPTECGVSIFVYDKGKSSIFTLVQPEALRYLFMLSICPIGKNGVSLRLAGCGFGLNMLIRVANEN